MPLLEFPFPRLPGDARTARREREREDWGCVRSVIEHENELINHRLTWNNVLQTVLFIAFSTLFTASAKFIYLDNGNVRPNPPIVVMLCLSVPPVLVPFAAIGACLVIIATVNAANITSSRIMTWWYLKCADGNAAEAWKLRSRTIDPRMKVGEHPPICGILDDPPFRRLGTEVLPHFFLWFWVIAEVASLVMCSILVLGPQRFDDLCCTTLILFVVIIGGTVVLFRMFFLSQFCNANYLSCRLPDIGYDLELLPSPCSIPDIENKVANGASGKVIVGEIDDTLHFRVLDAENKLVRFTNEDELKGRAEPILELRRQLSPLRGWEDCWYRKQLRCSSGGEAGPVLRAMRFFFGRRDFDTLDRFEQSVLIAKVLAIVDVNGSPDPTV